MGFDTAIFVSPVSESLICPVCLDAVELATISCVNGHTVCHSCLKDLTICPTCREEKLTPGVPNRVVIDLVYTLKVRCSVKNHENAEDCCKWEGTLKSYEERHKRLCRWNRPGIAHKSYAGTFAKDLYNDAAKDDDQVRFIDGMQKVLMGVNPEPYLGVICMDLNAYCVCEDLVLTVIVEILVAAARIGVEKSILPCDLEKSIFAMKTFKNGIVSHAIKEGRKSMDNPKELLIDSRILKKKLMQSIKFAIHKDAWLYLTAVFEYLCSELMELAGKSSGARGDICINSADIQSAISNDAELCVLFKKIKIIDGGVLPCIQPEFLPTFPYDLKPDEHEIEQAGVCAPYVVDFDQGDIDLKAYDSVKKIADDSPDLYSDLFDNFKLNEMISKEKRGKKRKNSEDPKVKNVTTEVSYDFVFSKGMIHQLTARAGIIRISGQLYDAIREVADEFLQQLVQSCMGCTADSKWGEFVILTIGDVRNILNILGYPVAGIGTPGCNGVLAKISEYKRIALIMKRKAGRNEPKQDETVKKKDERSVNIKDYYTGDNELIINHLKRHLESERFIREMQLQSTERIIPFIVIAEWLSRIKCDYAGGGYCFFSPPALNLIDFALESYLTELLQHASLNAIHSNRRIVTPKDIHLARRLRGETLPC